MLRDARRQAHEATRASLPLGRRAVRRTLQIQHTRMLSAQGEVMSRHHTGCGNV